MEHESPSPGDVLADQLKVWRLFRLLTGKQLEERVAALGGYLKRATISKIETGKRPVSLDEALLLAAALNVPPPLLFFPMKTGDPVRITSISEIHPDLALRWLSGEGPLAVTDRRAMNLAEWSEAKWTEAAKALRLYDAHREASRRAGRADLDVRRALVAGDAEGAKSARYRLQDRLHGLVDVRKAMVAEGMTPPWLEPRWFADMKRIEQEA